jgi:hypothetical protein
MSEISSHFSHLNIVYLKQKAITLAAEYRGIIAISLFSCPPSLKTDKQLYLLVWEMDNAVNNRKSSITFGIDFYSNELFGRTDFLHAYKGYHQMITTDELNSMPYIPYRIADDWEILKIDSDKDFPDDLCYLNSILLYSKTHKKRKIYNDSVKRVFVELALEPAERLWDYILENVHNSGQSIISMHENKLLEIAMIAFEKKDFSPLDKRYIDKDLFKFSRSKKEREDFLTRIISRAFAESPFGPISINSCCQIIADIRKT